MKIYSTKYALSSGILEHEAEETHLPTMVCIPRTDTTFSYCLHGEGCQWHRTKESAVERAEAMRVAKIKALRKQIAKLEGMKFE